MDPFRREVLEIIAAHDGQHSWYQIDRILSDFSPNGGRNLPLLNGLMRVLRDLENDRMILARESDISSQPVYSITAQGRRALDEALKGHEVG
jgi:DNA-binding PadR family transcriptional regulator